MNTVKIEGRAHYGKAKGLMGGDVLVHNDGIIYIKCISSYASGILLIKGKDLTGVEVSTCIEPTAVVTYIRKEPKVVYEIDTDNYVIRENPFDGLSYSAKESLTTSGVYDNMFLRKEEAEISMENKKCSEIKEHEERKSNLEKEMSALEEQLWALEDKLEGVEERLRFIKLTRLRDL